MVLVVLQSLVDVACLWLGIPPYWVSASYRLPKGSLYQVLDPKAVSGRQETSMEGHVMLVSGQVIVELVQENLAPLDLFCLEAGQGRCWSRSPVFQY